MLPSKKLISLPIISLKEGLKIGYVRNIIINPQTRAVAALIVDPKRFFTEQRIIPFHRVVSIGENAITVSTESQVEKATNLPDIMQLIKEKTAVIGMKVLTASGKTLGVVDEFYIDREDGHILYLDLSAGKIEGLFYGKARLRTEEIVTLGSDVMVVSEDSEDRLEGSARGINDNIKSWLKNSSAKIIRQGDRVNSIRKRKKEKVNVPENMPAILQEDPPPAGNLSNQETEEGNNQACKET